jgi:hypothetical protein
MQECSALTNADETLKQDREIVNAVVKLDVNALKYVDELL